MQFTWLSLVPPLVVLVCGFISRKVLLSLIFGLLSAAFIATDFSLLGTLRLSLQRLWNNTEVWKFISPSEFWQNEKGFIIIFLFCLSIIVTLTAYSGGAHACAKLTKKYIRNRKSAESSSLLLSLLFFIDDYFSSLSVGAVMHPITDVFKVPRVKLAFLVDAMAAPLAIMCPISSWVAAIIGFLSENGISEDISQGTLILADPFSVYMRIIPFMFYSFLIMGGAWFIVRRRIAYGSMKQQEDIAQKTGNLAGGKELVQQTIRTSPEENKNNSTIIDFLFPVISLLISVIIGMLFSGNYFSSTQTFLGAMHNSNASITLFVGGLLALTACTIYYLLRKRITLTEIPALYWDGIKLMAPAIAVLLLAWTFSDVLREDLKTGQYLASIFVGGVSIALLPVMFFLASIATSFAIGSSWATIAIFLPIAIPMLISMSGLAIPTLLSQVSVLFPLLGAVFSGAVAGDHISPISDTTLMSSTSTGSHHIDHVQTQIPYTLPVIIGTTLAFLIAGFLAPYGILIAAPVSGIVGLLTSFVIYTLVNQNKK